MKNYGYPRILGSCPRPWLRSLLAAGTLVTLAACGGGDGADGGTNSSSCVSTATATCIGAGGGSVRGAAGASMLVPANALTMETLLSINNDVANAPSLPSGTSVASAVVQLLPHGTVFAQPVTINLPFDASTLAPGTVPRLYKAQPNGAYTEVSPVTVSGNMLSAKVSSFSFFVITANRVPTALLTLPGGGAYAGESLEFSAGGSTDTEDTIVSYTWDFGDSTDVVQGTDSANPTHTYSTPGQYTVRLIVTDSQGATNEASATLSVIQRPLVCEPPKTLSNDVCMTVNLSPSASATVSPTTPITGQEIALNPAPSADADGSLVSYKWNFGDGSEVTTSTPDIQYKSWVTTGAKTVTLTVRDNQGAENTYTQVITVGVLTPTGVLNDTGIDWCSENITTPSAWVNNAVCSGVNWAGNLWGQQQDAFSGRDAQARAGTLSKVGGGMAGFDFTKLGANGKPLAIQNGSWTHDSSGKDNGSEAAGTRWDCVGDNTTGLVWEVKRNDATHLRHLSHTYSWYNANNANNGGAVGSEAGTSAVCKGVSDTAKCNTQSIVTAVNALPSGQALCGFRDWRMPTVDELYTLAHNGRDIPAIDVTYFPNTTAARYWSSSPVSPDSRDAWIVDFDYGSIGGARKDAAVRIRLVRSGQ